MPLESHIQLLSSQGMHLGNVGVAAWGGGAASISHFALSLQEIEVQRGLERVERLHNTKLKWNQLLWLFCFPTILARPHGAESFRRGLKR